MVNIDFQILNFLYNIRDPFFTKLLLLVTQLGSVKWILIGATIITIFLLIKKQYFDIVALFTTLFSGGLLTSLIKIITKRPRPEWPFPVYYEPSFSFPSFHATGAVLLYGFIIYLVWQNSSSRKIKRFSFVLSIFIILVIGFSRLYLGVHYFSDVVAGYILGILCLIGGIYGSKLKIKYQKSKLQIKMLK